MPKIAIKADSLFQRVVNILEQAKDNVAQSVNTNMVVAYWLIGHEIVQEMQEGKERAEYGQQVLLELSNKLNKQYGSGFSIPNLQNFRKFYLVFNERILIQYPVGTKLTDDEKICPMNNNFNTNSKQYPMGSELQNTFSPNLSWSHYRALMRVKDCEARNFYEREAEECCWSKAQLERQIHSSYYERILSNKGKELTEELKKERRLIEEHLNDNREKTLKK